MRKLGPSFLDGFMSTMNLMGLFPGSFLKRRRRLQTREEFYSDMQRSLRHDMNAAFSRLERTIRQVQDEAKAQETES